MGGNFEILASCVSCSEMPPKNCVGVPKKPKKSRESLIQQTLSLSFKIWRGLTLTDIRWTHRLAV